MSPLEKELERLGAEPRALWVRCPFCEGFWCRKHRSHTGECACLPIEELELDPSVEGRPSS